MNINRVLNVIYIALMFMCFINVKTYAQKKTIIYEMGRPNALDYNIAKRIIGKEYKLAFIYVGQKMTDSLGVEYFEEKNRISIAKKARKYGEDWSREFNKKINTELSVHYSLGAIIKKTKEYENIKNNEIYILFDRKRCTIKKYCAYIAGRVLIDNQYKMKVFLKMRVNAKSKQIKKMIEKEMPLPYTFEENGIY